MVRSEQTHAPPRDVPRVQHFIDHTGANAIRARIAPPGTNGDIAANDFTKNPVFAFQVYTLVNLHLDEPTAKRLRLDTKDGSRPTELHSLVHSLGPMNSERPAPVFDIYPDPQPDVFACVAHQKREIAYRKARAENPETLLIPKVAMNWELSPNNGRTGFCIIITSDMRALKLGGGSRDPAGISPVLWARFRRGPSTSFGYETTFTRLVDYYAQRGERSSEFQLLYDASFTRQDIDCDLESDSNEVIRPLGQYCDLGLQDAEENFTTDLTKSCASEKNLEDMAQRLSLENFSVDETVSDTVIVSNHLLDAEPDLRYLIYVTFLPASNSHASLNQVAKAFTASITSHLADGKTISFEFRKPPNQSYSSILADFHSQLESKPAQDHIGALLNLQEGGVDSPVFVGRLHCQSRSLQRRYNIFDLDDEDDRDAPVRYGTFIVVLRDPENLAKGGVEYLLADAVPGAYVKRHRQMYEEMIMWRNEGVEETARRLEMRLHT